jgi:hypothetical protein
MPGVAACCNDAQCGHPLGRRKSGRVLTFLILILPVSLSAMFSPKDFSLSTFLNRVIATDSRGLVKRTGAPRGGSTQPQPAAYNPAEPPLPTKNGSQPAAQASPASTDDYLPKSKDGNIVVQVIDLLYAAQDTSLRADFEGKTVETEGPSRSSKPQA